MVDRTGTHVLLVEDNDINSNWRGTVGDGAIVPIAADGRAGVDAVKTHHFDGVLMDVQMPVLYGYAATREDQGRSTFQNLLNHRHDRQRHVRGDREWLIESGMDDYVTKPLDLEQLFAVLRKWVKPAHAKLPVDANVRPRLLYI